MRRRSPARLGHSISDGWAVRCVRNEEWGVGVRTPSDDKHGHPTQVTSQGEVALLYPNLPPSVDGVGDYTAGLANALAPYSRVRVFTSAATWTGILPEVNIVPIRAMQRGFGLFRVLRELRRHRPAVVLWQYTPFTYSPKGLISLWVLFPLICRWLGIRVVTAFHECYFERHWLGWRSVVWGIAQRISFFLTLWTSPVSVLTTRERVERTRRMACSVAPGRLALAPIPTNIPVVANNEGARSALLRRLGIGPQDFVLVTFRLWREGRIVKMLFDALSSPELREVSWKMIMLGDTSAVGWANEAKRMASQVGLNDRLVWPGYLSAEEVSHVLRASHIAFALYNDGVSSRRGTAAAFFAHGCCIIANDGPATDGHPYRDGVECLLVGDDPHELTAAILRLYQQPALRQQLGRAARARYEIWQSWLVVAAQFRSLLVDKRPHNAAPNY